MSPQALEANSQSFCWYKVWFNDHRPSFRQTCEKIQKHDSHWNLWIWP